MTRDLTEEEIEALINEYIELGNQIKELKAKQDADKKLYTEWLDNRNAKSVATSNFTAKLMSRKGSVDLKAVQASYGISDSELEKYRKDGTTYWTVKEKK